MRGIWKALEAARRFTRTTDEQDRMIAALECFANLDGRGGTGWEWPTENGPVVMLDVEVASAVVDHLRDGTEAIAAPGFSHLDPEAFGNGFVARAITLKWFERDQVEAMAAAAGLRAYVAAGMAMGVRP